jgi:hypothetical protein
MTEGKAQVVEYSGETLSSNPSAAKKKKKVSLRLLISLYIYISNKEL